VGLLGLAASDDAGAVEEAGALDAGAVDEAGAVPQPEAMSTSARVKATHRIRDSFLHIYNTSYNFKGSVDWNNPLTEAFLPYVVRYASDLIFHRNRLKDAF